jgi:hypothetical protein
MILLVFVLVGSSVLISVIAGCLAGASAWAYIAINRMLRSREWDQLQPGGTTEDSDADRTARPHINSK